MSKDDFFISPREQAKQVRDKCPSAYALTINEAIRINRIDSLIWQFFSNHPEFVKEQEVGISQATGQPIKKGVYVYDDTSIGMIKDQLRRRRINLDNAYAMAERILSGHWFYIIGIFNPSGDPSKAMMSLYVDGEDKGAISRDAFPSFYEIYEAEEYTNAEGLRQALRLDDDCKLICPGELNTLRLIKFIAEGTVEPVDIVEGYMAIKSLPQTTALANIGSMALSKAQYDELNETFTVMAATGVRVTLKGDMIKPKRWVSLDKLWRQINNVAHDTRYVSKVIKFSLDDYMRLRGLKNRKQAREQLTEDNEEFAELWLDYGNGGRGSRIVEAKPYIKNSESIYYLTDTAFIMLSSNASTQYYPEYLMSLTGNAYMIGAFIEDHIRRNIGNPNETRISIIRLLESTTLPLASEVQPKHYRLRIIEPFFSNLSKVVNSGGISYRIVHGGGNPLSSLEETEVHYDYNLFASCLIEITKESEPKEYTKLRQQRLTEAKAREEGKLKGVRKKAEAKAMGKPIKKS